MAAYTGRVALCPSGFPELPTIGSFLRLAYIAAGSAVFMYTVRAVKYRRDEH